MRNFKVVEKIKIHISRSISPTPRENLSFYEIKLKTLVEPGRP